MGAKAPPLCNLKQYKRLCINIRIALKVAIALKKLLTMTAKQKQISQLIYICHNIICISKAVKPVKLTNYKLSTCKSSSTERSLIVTY